VVARTWRVPGDAPTIQAGIGLAQIGDDVLVAPGVYTEHDLMMKDGIVVHSEGGPSATILDAAGMGIGFQCIDLMQGGTIDGLTIRNGLVAGQNESGGGIRCVGVTLTVRNCVVSQCVAGYQGGGIYASGSAIVIDACRVTNCSSSFDGGGIYAVNTRSVITDSEIVDNEAGAFSGGIMAHGPEVQILRSVVSGNVALWGATGGIGCMSPAFVIRDCVITRNACYDFGLAGGLGIDSSSGVIEGCTVAENYGYPPPGGIALSFSNVEIKTTIVALNDGPAFSLCYGSNVSEECCDVFGNSQGSVFCGDDLGGNFSDDPQFCDAANGDYTLDGQSPCLPGNHPDGVDCGLIGARDAGCGTSPTGACCFVDGPCLVLGQAACGDQGGNYMGNGTTCDPNPCEPVPIQSTTWGRIKASYR
jgi:hypothetical protein